MSTTEAETPSNSAVPAIRIEPMPEVRGQKPEIRGQKPEVRGQKPEVRSQKSDVRSQKGRGAMKPWRGIPPRLNTQTLWDDMI